MTVTDPEKLEFIHGLTKDVPHGRRSFFDHLLKTAGVMEKLCKDISINESRYLIDAALFHSIYGTSYFKHRSDVTREKVTLIIGEKAETLVEFYCNLPDRFKFFSINLNQINYKEICICWSMLMWWNNLLMMFNQQEL